MSSASKDLTGGWDGTFDYPKGPGAGSATPFLATIKDSGGVIEGTIIEPHLYRPGRAHASVLGQRIGTSVHFSKSYEGAGEWYKSAVIYDGTLSDDGEMISGEWSIGPIRGMFEMTRQPSAEELVEAKVEAAADLEL